MTVIHLADHRRHPTTIYLDAVRRQRRYEAARQLVANGRLRPASALVRGELAARRRDRGRNPKDAA